MNLLKFMEKYASDDAELPPAASLRAGADRQRGEGGAFPSLNTINGLLASPSSSSAASARFGVAATHQPSPSSEPGDREAAALEQWDATYRHGATAGGNGYAADDDGDDDEHTGDGKRAKVGAPFSKLSIFGDAGARRGVRVVRRQVFVACRPAASAHLFGCLCSLETVLR